MRSCFARAIFALGCAVPAIAQAQVSIVGGAPPTQTFDSLAASGSSSMLPAGWALLESGSNANTSYTADNGASMSGDTYSYGSTGSSDRALGTLQSGSVNPTIGARLQNATGATLVELQVEYAGEQWRLGATGREDRLDFQYSLNATALNDGAWVDVAALDLVAPVTTGTAGAALDGNANAVSRSSVISGLSLANGATIWVRWTDLNPSGSDDGLAVDDVVFSVPGDNPPRVSTTVPTNGATSVGRNASSTINFTEPVTVTGAWYDITCVPSGAHAATVTGGPMSYVLDPSVDFAYGDECTVTIEEANVVDQDGTPDPMGASHRFTFDVEVEAIDTRPTVESVVPAAGASNVSMNASLTIKFSEAVTAPASAFAVSCANSGKHSFALTGGPNTFSLDPDVDFDEVETCTLSIDADQVIDQDGAIESMVADFLASFTTRAGAGDYYAGVDASSCVALRTTLHDVIDDHTVFSYGDAWTILEEADEDPTDPTKILDIYRNRKYDKVTRRAGGSTPNDGTYYNREHTWPNSLGFGSATSGGLPNAPYTDTHMLYLSATDYNSNRGNDPYEVCSTAPMPTCTADEDETDANGGFGGGTGTYPGNSNWDLADGYEVWGRRKGDAARAVLYMAVRYDGGNHGTTGQSEPDLEITEIRSQISSSPTAGKFYMGYRSALVAWHAADPPDTQESLRNDVIFSYQQNRNPFIDHPEWVAIAFADPCTGSAPANQPPVLGNATHAVLENAPNGTTITTLVATDPNAGQQVSYAILSGNASGAFALSTGGVLTVANGALVDPALAASHSLVVRATDNGTPAMSDDATITVNVTAVNDAPSFAKGADASVAEDAGPQSIPGWASAISAGPSDESAQSVSFAVTANTNSGLFAIAPAVSTNGTLTFTAAANASGSAAITLRARDTGGTANGGVDASPTQSFAITVTAVDDVAIANDDDATVGEDSGANSIAVLGNDSDVDGGAFVVTSVTTVTGGTTAVEASGANVTFTPSANFCGTTSFGYTISGGDNATVTVVVACINDAPVAIDASGTILAGSPPGTVVASVAASDADSTSLAWSISSGNTGGAFAIDPATGIVSVAIPGAVQATSSPFALVVTVSDDSVPAQADTATVAVTVTARGDALFGNGFEGP